MGAIGRSTRIEHTDLMAEILEAMREQRRMASDTGASDLDSNDYFAMATGQGGGAQEYYVERDPIFAPFAQNIDAFHSLHEERRNAHKEAEKKAQEQFENVQKGAQELEHKRRETQRELAANISSKARFATSEH